ncbi:MAG: V-type ATP synthase subunit D, partial [Erysipelothrix sp.]|nr:V-type ATP synthase subunit D [Erysipelothrix sp.]
VELAELEKTCFILGNEIRATRRRVNALEHRTIPQFEVTIDYIRLRIDDQARSQQSRVMKVTNKA